MNTRKKQENQLKMIEVQFEKHLEMDDLIEIDTREKFQQT